MGKKAILGSGRHAIDRRTGQVLTYVFGRRKAQVFIQLKRLLARYSVCTDGWGAHERHLPAENHDGGRRLRQLKESIWLRTRIKRLARQTICFRSSGIDA